MQNQTLPSNGGKKSGLVELNKQYWFSVVNRQKSLRLAMTDINLWHIFFKSVPTQCSVERQLMFWKFIFHLVKLLLLRNWPLR